MKYIWLICLAALTGAAMAATPLFQGELDITNIAINEEFVSYRVAGTFYDGSVVGFTALDIATNDLVSTENIIGHVDIWQITNIVAQSASVITADVVYAQSGTSTLGMVAGVAAVFTLSTNNTGFGQQPSSTGARVSDHMLNEIRNYNFRRISEGGADLTAAFTAHTNNESADIQHLTAAEKAIATNAVQQGDDGTWTNLSEYNNDAGFVTDDTGATNIAAGASDSYNAGTRTLTWNTNAAGGGSAGDFKADGSVPMTGDINLGGKAATNGGAIYATNGAFSGTLTVDGNAVLTNAVTEYGTTDSTAYRGDWGAGLSNSCASNAITRWSGYPATQMIQRVVYIGSGTQTVYSDGQFEIWSDNTNVVYDQDSGLMWARDGYVLGDITNWFTTTNLVDLLDYAGYTDWRLPSKEELETILPIPSGHPFFDLEGRYWSSTEKGSLAGSYAYTDSTISFYHNKEIYYFRVHPVRNAVPATNWFGMDKDGVFKIEGGNFDVNGGVITNGGTIYFTNGVFSDTLTLGGNTVLTNAVGTTNASGIHVAHSAVSYSPATADVEAHINGIDEALTNKVKWTNGASSDAFLKRDGSLPMTGELETPSLKITGGSPTEGAVWRSTGTDGAGEWSTSTPGWSLSVGAAKVMTNATFTRCGFDTIVYSNSVVFDLENYQVTPQVPGWYIVTANPKFLGPSSAAAREGFIEIRGPGADPVAEMYSKDTWGNWYRPCATALQYFNGSDAGYINCYHNFGNDITNCVAAGQVFSGRFIGK